MRRISMTLAACAVMAAVVPLRAAPAASNEPPRKGSLAALRAAVIPGELLVSFRDGAGKGAARRAHSAVGARVLRRLPGLGIQHVRLPAGISTEAGLANYRSDPAVVHAEPNLRRSLFETIPADGSFPEQWHLKNVGQQHPVADPFYSGFSPVPTAAGSPGADGRVTFAWDQGLGTAETVIAVLDIGVDVMHPDLAANIWTNPSEAAGVPGVDDDANGYVDDVHGCDFVDRDCTNLLEPASTPGFDHGTHVAGIAAAVKDDIPTAPNVVGVCPGCKVMVLKFGLDLASELAALAYAQRMGADIVNASFGGLLWSRMEYDMIATIGQTGVLLVAAAGNDGLDNDLFVISLDGRVSPSFPSTYTLPNVLSVAGSTHTDEYGYFTGCALAGVGTKSDCLYSNFGRESVDVAAPGTDILSALPSGAYGTFTGTSMAAPFVSGVAGLVKSMNQVLGAVDVRNAILNGAAQPLGMDALTIAGKVRPGSYSVTNNGRADALGAIGATTAALFGAPTDGSIAGARSMSGKTMASGRLTWPSDDNDVFKKRLSKGTYRVELDGPRKKDFDLFVWKPGTTEIWQFEPPCLSSAPGPCKLRASRQGASADEVIRKMRVKKKGIYFFHVSAFYFQAGRYTLRVTKA